MWAAAGQCCRTGHPRLKSPCSPPPPNCLLGARSYDQSAWRTESGDVALGHVTNYAQNMDGTVWDLQQLEEHMGEAGGRRTGDGEMGEAEVEGPCSRILMHA